MGTLACHYCKNELSISKFVNDNQIIIHDSHEKGNNLKSDRTLAGLQNSMSKDFRHLYEDNLTTNAMKFTTTGGDETKRIKGDIIDVNDLNEINNVIENIDINNLMKAKQGFSKVQYIDDLEKAIDNELNINKDNNHNKHHIHHHINQPHNHHIDKSKNYSNDNLIEDQSNPVRLIIHAKKPSTFKQYDISQFAFCIDDLKNEYYSGREEDGYNTDRGVYRGNYINL